MGYRRNTIIETAGENLLERDICYLKSDGKYWKASNISVNTSRGKLLICMETILASNKGKFNTENFLGALIVDATVGAPLYLGVNGTYITGTAMLLLTTGSIVRRIGILNKNGRLFFKPSNTFVEIL